MFWGRAGKNEKKWKNEFFLKKKKKTEKRENIKMQKIRK